MQNVVRLLPLATVAVLAACATAPAGAAAGGDAAVAQTQALRQTDTSPRRLVMIAGRPSHGPGQHEHNAGVALLQRCLQNVPGIQAVAHFGGWPSDPNALDGADAILIYADGGGGHPAIQEDRLQQLGRHMDRGVGLAALHYAVEVPVETGGQEFTRWLGGHYETNYSVNPIWVAQYEGFPVHPITRGVQPFSTRDEWYFSIRFRPGMEGVTPILQARPSDETRDGPYVSPRGPYPHIQAAKGQVETMAWAVERPDGGRGFGYTGGHFHENWGNSEARKLVLNALVWVSGAEVPPGGVSCTVTPEDLQRNLDPK
jgi:type 1 glutamine amidotransferase